MRNGKEHRKALHFQVYGMEACFENNLKGEITTS